MIVGQLVCSGARPPMGMKAAFAASEAKLSRFPRRTHSVPASMTAAPTIE